MSNYPEEVKITSFSPYANAHRNLNRPTVDALFAQAQSAISRSYNTKNRKEQQKWKDQADKYKEQARQQWRAIVTHANTI